MIGYLVYDVLTLTTLGNGLHLELKRKRNSYTPGNYKTSCMHLAMLKVKGARAGCDDKGEGCTCRMHARGVKCYI